MLKKILLVLLVVTFVGLLGFVYYSLTQLRQTSSDAIHAVPSSAAFLIESNNTLQVWQQLNNTNIIWQELIAVPFFANLQQQLIHVDSLQQKNQDIAQLLKSQSLLISVHATGAKNFDFLFLMNLPASIFQEEAEKMLLQSLPAHRKFSPKMLEDVTIWISDATGPDAFAYCFIDNIFIGSKQPMLVENAIGQLRSGPSLMETPDFAKIKNTAGSKGLNVYVNFKQAHQVLAPLFGDDQEAFVKSWEHFSGWSELDLRFKPNAFQLNGFFQASDSGAKYLSTFKNQKPVPLNATKVIPANALYFAHLGLSNRPNFSVEYAKWQKATGNLTDAEAKIPPALKEQGSELLLSWINEEVAMLLLENRISREPYQIGLFQTLSTREVTDNFMDYLNQQEDHTIDSTTYMGHTITGVGFGSAYEAYFGKWFAGLKADYFTTLDDYVIFASSPNALKEVIKSYENQKTLAKDLGYQSFAENLSEASNLMLYTSVPGMLEYALGAFAEEPLESIQPHIDLLKKFERSVLQISTAKKDLYYGNLYVKFNPEQKQEQESLWETELDATISQKPYLFVNHYTKLREIFVQDDQNTIHLISNTGKVLWKRQLDNPIIGSPRQIDAFANGKLQILFNTSDKLYLIDRNGKNVSGFPVQFKSPATNPLVVIDYESNNKYRILVASGKKVFNYDIDGKAVRGWAPKNMPDTINEIVHYFRIKKKDYITVIDRGGHVRVIDRTGKSRMTIKNKLPARSEQAIFLKPGKNLKESTLITTDSTGKVTLLYFNDKLKTVDIGTFSPAHRFIHCDANSDQANDFVVVDGNEVAAFHQDGEAIYRIQLDSSITAFPLQHFRFSSSQVGIGVVSTNSNELWLIDEAGALSEGWPLKGGSPFSIGDINRDGKFEVIVGNADKNIYTYTLD